MASFAALRMAASRRLAPRIALQQTQRRNLALGGHSGPPPEWTGIDKVVRSYFPEDWQRTYTLVEAKFRIPSRKFYRTLIAMESLVSRHPSRFLAQLPLPF